MDPVFVVDLAGTLRSTLTRELARVGIEAITLPRGTALVTTEPTSGSARPLPDFGRCADALARLAAELEDQGWSVPVLFIAPKAERADAPARAATAPKTASNGRDPESGQADESSELLARYAKLTPREREVANLVVAGLMNKQIAAQLGLAERTVKLHRAHVMTKLGARSLPDLVRSLDRVSQAQ